MLTSDRVHLIRTSGFTDTHWARKFRMGRQAIFHARIGNTWKSHPTLPDLVPRKGGGRMAGKKALRLTSSEQP